MKINDIVNESTTSGAIATVAQPMTTQSRSNVGKGVYGNEPVGSMFKGKKTRKKYANSKVNEGKMKQLAMDLRDMDNGNFQKKYKKSKEQMTNILDTPDNMKPKSKMEVNESVSLRFHTTELLPEQYWNYVITHFERNNINRPHPSYITNLRVIKESKYKLTESQEFEDIQPFIKSINRVDSKKTVKVGDKFAVLNFEIIYYHKEIIVYGFTKPATVVAVKLHNDGTINQIKFADGSVYPRQHKVTLNKRSIEQAAYFETEKQAEHALTVLRLSIPDGWEFDTSGLDTQLNNSRETTMKIKEISEAHLEEDDLILVPGQGHRLKTGFHPYDPDKAEHEGETLKNSLRTIARNARELHDRLENHDQFPEWVSEKIGAIKNMMTGVTEYLISHQPSNESAGVIAGGGVGESLANWRMGIQSIPRTTEWKRKKITAISPGPMGKEYTFDNEEQAIHHFGKENWEKIKSGFVFPKWNKPWEVIYADDVNEGEGLRANIHAKRERIKHGSGERMRKPGSKGAPSAQDFKDAADEGAITTKPVRGEKPWSPPRTEPKKKYPAIGTVAWESLPKSTKIELLKKRGRDPNEYFGTTGLEEAQSMGTALKNTLAKAEPGSKLDNSIKSHNRHIKAGQAGTLKNAPSGYHFDSKGYCRLGDK